MNLPELRRVELGDQFLDRLANQRFLARRLHTGVLLVGDEEQHLVDRDHADLGADRRLDPSQPRLRLELLGKARERLLQRIR